MPQVPRRASSSRAARHVPTLAALVLVVLFLFAAHWQYTRIDDMAELRAALEVASASPAITLPHGAKLLLQQFNILTSEFETGFVLDHIEIGGRRLQ